MRSFPPNAPEDVKQLAEQLITMLEGHDLETVGPSISLAFAYVILDLAGCPDDDVAAMGRITDDITKLVIAHGAATARPTH